VSPELRRRLHWFLGIQFVLAAAFVASGVITQTATIDPSVRLAVVAFMALLSIVWLWFGLGRVQRAFAAAGLRFSAADRRRARWFGVVLGAVIAFRFLWQRLADFALAASTAGSSALQLSVALVVAAIIGAVVSALFSRLFLVLGATRM